jgi:hypothetical protein
MYIFSGDVARPCGKSRKGISMLSIYQWIVFLAIGIFASAVRVYLTYYLADDLRSQSDDIPSVRDICDKD